MKIKDYLIQIVFVLSILFFWELLVRVYQVPAWRLPAPSKIVMSLIDLRELLLDHSIRTLQEAIIGLAMAIAAGIAMGAVAHEFPLIRKTIYPLLVVSQTIPIIVLAPLLVIWLGYGLLPKLLVVALACFFPIAVNTVAGMEQTDIEVKGLLRSMGYQRWMIFKIASIPSAMPVIFSGIRIAATYAIMAAVVAEWMGSDKGLGVFVIRSFNSYLTDRVFAGIILISLFSIGLFALVGVLERLIIPWHYKMELNDLTKSGNNVNM